MALVSGLLVACADTEVGSRDVVADPAPSQMETVPSERASPGGPKRVVIDKTKQELRAYEGDQLVQQSEISTGAQGRRTPNGTYEVGVKWRMHHSTIYDDAPMPYSVQVTGDYFIHGYHKVPDYPASHGCIRLPLSGANPAKQFFNWVEKDTTIEIVGEWQG